MKYWYDMDSREVETFKNKYDNSKLYFISSITRRWEKVNTIYCKLKQIPGIIFYKKYLGGY